MQKGMNFTSYVAISEMLGTTLNFDPNRYLNSVSTETQIERGDLFLK